MRSVLPHTVRTVPTVLIALVPMLLVDAGCPAPEPSPVTPQPPTAIAIDAAIVVDAPAPGPPPARVLEVTDLKFGLEVTDPYRWMETGEAELAAWLRVQGAYTTAELAKLPGRDKLAARVRELGFGVSAVFGVQLAGGRVFHQVLGAGESLAKLAVVEAKGDRVLVDPSKLGGPEGHAALHAYAPSPDGLYVAYVISTGGGEVGTLHVMEVATGRELPDAIERVWGEGSAAWLPDGKRFFYTQLAVPAPGVDPMLGQTARLHKLGEPVDRDITILGRTPGATLKLAPEEWPGLWAPPGSGYVFATVGGAHSEERLAIARLGELDLKGTSKTRWRVVAEYADGVEEAVPHGNRIYLKSFVGSPNRRIVSVPLDAPTLANARVEIREAPDAALTTMAAAKDALYVLQQHDGHAVVLRWPWSGKATALALPYDGWVPDLTTDMRANGVTFQIENWLRPGTYFALDAKTKKLVPAGLASASSADYSSIVAEEVEATSADGTKIPLSILHTKELARDGSHPTIVSAYGAYGTSQLQGFSATRLVWLEHGGVLAVAHIRGGGEKGRRWQDDGSREHKLDGVKDLIACGEYLVANRYTTPAKLGVTGGSMGGVAVGRAITLRPDLFAAANIGAGIVNPLRILAADNGANQKAELGDPATEAGYKSILAMDPYQHVERAAAYPAVLFTVGLNDHRVAPWMTAKFAARLAAATTSHRPVLVRVDADAGHGLGSTRDQAFSERADIWAFFLSAFGDSEYTPPRP